MRKNSVKHNWGTSEQKVKLWIFGLFFVVLMFFVSRQGRQTRWNQTRFQWNTFKNLLFSSNVSFFFIHSSCFFCPTSNAVLGVFFAENHTFLYLHPSILFMLQTLYFKFQKDSLQSSNRKQMLFRVWETFFDFFLPSHKFQCIDNPFFSLVGLVLKWTILVLTIWNV